MQKGKFGFSLWLYPFISLWLMLFDQTLANVLILGFVIVAEKDEWAIKQCAQVLMFGIYWGMYNFIMDMIIGGLSSIPLVGGIAATPLNIIDTVVWIVLVILCFVLGLSRLKNGRDIGLPGKGIINRAYGFVQQQWNNQNQMPGQAPYAQQPLQQQPYAQQPYQQGQYVVPQQPYEQQSYAQQPYQQGQYVPQQPVPMPPQAAPIPGWEQTEDNGSQIPPQQG